MKRQMYEVRVFVNAAGNVCLEQQPDPHDIPYLIQLHPDQVPTVVEWLQEASGEAIRLPSVRTRFPDPGLSPGVS